MARTCRMSTGGPRPNRLLKNREDQRRNAKKDEEKSSTVPKAREAKLPETPVSHRAPIRYRRALARRNFNRTTPTDTEINTNAEEQPEVEIIDGMDAQRKLEIARARTAMWKKALEKENTAGMTRRTCRMSTGGPRVNRLLKIQTQKGNMKNDEKTILQTMKAKKSKEAETSSSQDALSLASAQQSSIQQNPTRATPIDTNDSGMEQPEIEIIDVIFRTRTTDMAGNSFENALMEAQNKFNRALELQRISLNCFCHN